MTKKFAARSKKKTAETSPVDLSRSDADQAVKLVMKMMAIEGASGNEAEIVAFIVDQLHKAGADPKTIQTDRAHKKSPIPGATGNLIFKLPGSLRADRRMLSAHVDTVPICVGCRPVQKGRFVSSADPNTGLGADDRAGAAAVLTAALHILRRKLPHPPLTFLWPVQEEVGLQGAHHVDVAKLGSPKLAFNFDGGSPEKLTIGATGGYRLAIDIQGIASHAGGAPQDGVSAITIAALAIADLQSSGWHGLVQKPKGRGTSNVGVIQGGAATNVVADRVQIRAEARSHDPKFRKRIVRKIEEAFARAVKSVKNASGKRGKATIEGRLDYESFRLGLTEPSVVAADETLRSLGVEPQIAIADGGLDANWFTAHGIPTVTMGAGQMNIHTVNEQLDVDQFLLACRVALRLATGG